MADITLTPANVVATNPQTGKASGTSGAAILAGQPIFADPADNYRLKPAQANSANPSHVPNLVGVALDSAPGQNQPVTYATEGDVTYGCGLTQGQVYVVSAAAAGGIAPYADLGTGSFVGVLGVATSASVLKVDPIPTSTAKP
jgi:hypothetical protein